MPTVRLYDADVLMASTGNQIALLGGIDAEGDVAAARMDQTGRLLVVCPCCERKGTVAPGALYRIAAEWDPLP